MTNSVPSATTTLANSIGVNGGTATASQRTNCCTLLATRYSTNKRACASTTSGGQLVTMLLPEASAVLVPIANTSGMRMRYVTVSVP
ncbi:MAG: hypothetical protein LC775_13190 [Acidobacteria bacterium]|nr:hypothetical protein [Acidobacteriota bacterium]